jgi:hypothetical protein
MVRFLKLVWLSAVILGGGALVIFSLASADPGGAAVLAGIALLLGLVTLLFPDDGHDRRKHRGFEPHRRR